MRLNDRTQLGLLAPACRALSTESSGAMEVGWCVEWSEIEKGLNASRSAPAARVGTPEQVVGPDSIEGCLRWSIMPKLNGFRSPVNSGVMPLRYNKDSGVDTS